MSGAATVIFLDVDGVIVPIRSLTGDPAWGDWAEEAVPWMGVLGASASMLAALGTASATLVWATDWSDEANDTFASRIGCGRLPVVRPGDGNRHDWWKLGAITSWLSGHPEVARVVWVDDKIGDEGPDGRTWGAQLSDLLARSGVELLLVMPHPDTGLTAAEWTAANWWVG